MSAIASMADIGGTVGGSKKHYMALARSIRTKLGAAYEAGRRIRARVTDARPGDGCEAG